MILDHIEIQQASSSSKKDRIEFTDATYSNGSVRISAKISNLSERAINYMYNHNNSCYAKLYHYRSGQCGDCRYWESTDTNGEPIRHQKQHHWRPVDFNKYISTPNLSYSSAIYTTIEIDSSYFEDEHPGDDHLDFQPSWDFYYVKYIFRLTIHDDPSTAGHISPYSEVNSDILIVYLAEE